MDIVFCNILQDLNSFQSKIASLFEDLMKEKAYYKENLEHFCKNLKEASAETEKLKKEIEVLKEDNLQMKNIIVRAISLFKSSNFSKTSKQHTNELEGLKTVFLEYDRKMETAKLTDNMPSRDQTGKVTIKKYKLTENEIQKEIESLKNINFFNDLFNDAIIEKNTNKEGVLQRSHSEKAFTNCVGIKKNEEKVQNLRDVIKDSTLVPRTKSFGLDSTVGFEPASPVEIISERNKSPVFKDFNSRKHCGSSNTSEENGSNSMESWVSGLVNQKFLEKSGNSKTSSPEKCDTVNSSVSPKSPARKCTSFKIPNFRIAPTGMLKKSYSREIEKTPSGMKILTQTFLNIERFKRKSPKRKSPERKENENRGRLSSDAEKTSDEEIEDTIIEIPNMPEQVLKDIKNKKTSGPELEETLVMTPPLMTVSEPDLDETYVSSSFIRKHVLERGIDDQKPLKRHALERTPEKGPIYKDKPVRKKAERMNLPGHACLECNKYYQNALGDINTQDLKKILNKCSRHRQQYSPSLDDTPPDYWKPYLTSSTIMSPNS